VPFEYRFTAGIIEPMTVPSPALETTDNEPGDQTTAAWVILAVLSARVIYLIWLSPWELVGDEAYYWEWSRHLDWCYYEKGPGLAYLLAPFVKVFGVREFSLRLPMALLSAASAWILGRMAVSVSGNERAGLLAVILFCLTPAFVANAQLCTQDGVVILVWSVLSAYGLRLVRHLESGESRLRDWLLVAVWLGIGFLFKQSILLFLPTFLMYGWMRRKTLPWTRGLFLHIAIAGIVTALFAIPMLIWNAHHGWPTLAHTLGHLGAGGDQERADAHFTLLWFLSLLGAQIGAVGPGIVLMALTLWAALRQRNDPRYPARLWMICCAVPSLAFFFVLSFTKSVLGSWPFPSYVTLIVLTADLISSSRSRGVYRRRWQLAVVYGVGGALLIGFPTSLKHIPFLGKKMTSSILIKMTGHRQHASELDAARKKLVSVTGKPPIFIARYYMTAALDAFYLPDHPTVFCAGSEFGKRSTAYDFWSETNLADAHLHGCDAVLDGHGPRPWDGAFYFDKVEPSLGGAIYIGADYGGIIPRDKRPVVESGHE
jgi:hypothetical protein